MLTKFILFLISLFPCFVSCAQKFTSAVKPPIIGFHFSLVDYNSPNRIDTSSIKEVFAQGDIFNPGKQNAALSISYWRGLNKLIDFSGKFNGIFYDYTLNNTGNNINSGFGAELEGAINVRPISDNHFFSPFLTTGIGAGYYAGNLGGYVPLGLGLQFNFHSLVYFILQTQYRLSLAQNIFPNNLLHSAGITLNISKRKIIETERLPVSKILDRDGDGLVDTLDACPDEAGPRALQGCPDRDGDGIANKDDKCPDIPGMIKYYGCPVPDTDKDGINDEEDRCPNIPGLAQYNGCPIPDADKDGVNDELDRCPAIAGPASNHGCPLIDEIIVEKVNRAAQNIFFATGSSSILEKSFKSLKEIAQIMRDNSSFVIGIDGYTDNVGSNDLNQKLSESRANAVKKYLLDSGVEESCMTATGYGEVNPIADNNITTGRAKNRRVEIKIRNY